MAALLAWRMQIPEIPAAFAYLEDTSMPDIALSGSSPQRRQATMTMALKCKASWSILCVQCSRRSTSTLTQSQSSPLRPPWPPPPTNPLCVAPQLNRTPAILRTRKMMAIPRRHKFRQCPMVRIQIFLLSPLTCNAPPDPFVIFLIGRLILQNPCILYVDSTGTRWVMLFILQWPVGL